MDAATINAQVRRMLSWRRVCSTEPQRGQEVASDTPGRTGGPLDRGLGCITPERAALASAGGRDTNAQVGQLSSPLRAAVTPASRPAMACPVVIALLQLA